MAELSTPETSSSCCARVERATCCEPADNGACCETSAAGGSCGCAAGQSVEADIRETVRARYAAAATAVAESTQSGCCGAPDAIAGCGPDITSTDKHGNEVFGATLYDDADDPALKPAVEASLGCGVPTAVADLHDGETVLDLGSGAGADVLISAQRVGPTGEAIGLDMTDEMLDLARTNASEAGTENARIHQGLHGGHPAAGRLRGRGDLQLRNQPCRRQAQRAQSRSNGR